MSVEAIQEQAVTVKDVQTAGLCLEGAITLLTMAADCVGTFKGKDRVHAEASLDLALDQCRVVKRLVLDRIMANVK